jgi:hypothetical protein
LQENNGGSAASVTDGVVGGGEARGRGGELKMEARVIVSSFLIYFLLSFIKTITSTNYGSNKIDYYRIY